MFKKYPFVKQTGIKDCGVACLSMIIQFYQGYVPLSELRNYTHTTKQGTNAYHLVEAAKQLGMEAKGVRLPLSDFTKEEVLLPCIANVVIQESYQHYVVLYAIRPKKQQLLVADPGSGIKTYSFQEFSKIYQDVLLFFYPVRHLPRYPSPKHFLSFCGTLLKPDRKSFFFATVLSIMIMGLSFFQPFYIRNLLIALPNMDSRYLWLLAVLFGSLLLLRLCYEWVRSRLLSFLEMKLDGTLTCNFLNQILTLPYSSYRMQTTGEFIARIQDMESIKTLLSEGVVTILLDLFLTFFASLFLFHLNSNLFFFALLLFCSLLVLMFLLHSYWRKQVPKLKEEKANLTSVMIESIQSFETIKGLHLEKNFEQSFAEREIPYLKHLFTFQTRNHDYHLLQELFRQGGCFLLLVGSGFLTYQNQLSIPDLIFVQSILTYLFDPIQHLFSFRLSYEEAKTAFSRITELPQPEESKGLVCSNLEKFTLSHVSYPKEEPVLKDLSLSFQKGEKVLILGPSGCGKSTLLKILKGYYPIEQGCFRINGILSQHYQRSTLEQKVGYLSQEERLFTDTISNNILLHRQISQDQFLKVTSLCEVDAIADQKPLGYHTLLEENGFNISGGQKDRIVLARTLLNESEVYLIDEGFSQMEPALERRILTRLFEQYPDHLIVIVSHRPDNQDLFNRVITMEKGQIKTDQRKEYEHGMVSFLPTKTP